MLTTSPREQVKRGGTSRPPLAHAADPAAPDRALCGAKLTGRPVSASGDRCIVCRDLARQGFISRPVR